MDSQSTPRATAPYLDSYVGRNVTIVGKVVQLRGEQAVVNADGNISAHLNRVRIEAAWFSLLFLFFVPFCCLTPLPLLPTPPPQPSSRPLCLFRCKIGVSKVSKYTASSASSSSRGLFCLAPARSLVHY